MFGISAFESISYTWQYYFDTRIVILALIGTIGSTVFGLNKVRNIVNNIVETKYGLVLKQIIYLVLFIIAILFMVNSTYSPFIYFQY